MNPPKLWAHQEQALERAKNQPNLALFLDPGTGKTRTVIEIFRHHCNQKKRIRKTLILAPLAVTAQWKAEFLRFSKIEPDRVVVLNQSGPKRIRAFEQAFVQSGGDQFVVVTNYEALLTRDFYERLKTWEPEILVLDESQRCKDPSSKRFKLLKPLADSAYHRYILSGTPVLNSPLDIWSQYRLLDRGETFGDNFYSFRATYLYDKNAGMPRHIYFPKWVPRPDCEKRLAEKLSRTAVQARKEECLTLPPLVQVEVPVELGSDQRRAYDQMEELFVTEVQDKMIAANLAITKALRLRTILTGFVSDGEATPPLWFTENPRLDALVDLVRDLVPTGKVIVWTNFVPTYERISKALISAKISTTFLTGRQSALEKQHNIEEFTKGPVQVAICNPQAVGLGVNLIEAPYSVYFDRSYSLEHMIQSEARNYRGGSEMHQKVTHYHLVAKETLDEAILKALNSKTNLADAVMDWANKA